MSTKKTAKKIKNVLIISASFRPNSNSHALCQEVAKGVKAAGNKAEVIRLKDREIGFCTGCYACQKTGTCAIKDDAKKVIDKMMAADVIVLASPVYFYSISAQLKALFDRTVVVYPNLTNKKFYFILTMADTNRKMFDGVLAAMRSFLACCEGSKECGMVCASGVYEKGTVKGTKFTLAPASAMSPTSFAKSRNTLMRYRSGAQRRR